MTRAPPVPTLDLPSPRRIARIDESLCIGCTLCIRACPVDAIAGAAGTMHTVIAAQCTGCALCLPPCPVDCIGLLPQPAQRAHWAPPEAEAVRQRFDARNARLARDAAARRARRGTSVDHARRREVIAAAIGRAKARRKARGR